MSPGPGSPVTAPARGGRPAAATAVCSRAAHAERGENGHANDAHGERCVGTDRPVLMVDEDLHGLPELPVDGAQGLGAEDDLTGPGRWPASQKGEEAAPPVLADADRRH